MTRKYLALATALAAFCGLVLGALVLGGVTFATSQNTTYSACLKTGKLMKVTETGTPTCGSRARIATWNQQGPKGTTGPPGTQTMVVDSKTFASHGVDSGSVACPSGDVVTGGGYTSAASPSGLYVQNDGPFSTAGTIWGWRVTVSNATGASTLITMNVYAICAPGHETMST